MSRTFVARREWQRCWRKVRHLHEEVARQVATRIVAACLHHGVGLLRFDDLSWSSHSAKRVSGAWLATWQVHWFFSQIQERATLLVRIAGIAVELVDARGTSKRCSACGTIGNRNGKTFSCTNVDCEKMVDSDLNGSRNVRLAPTSPTRTGEPREWCTPTTFPTEDSRGLIDRSRLNSPPTASRNLDILGETSLFRSNCRPRAFTPALSLAS
jgi:transposase